MNPINYLVYHDREAFTDALPTLDEEADGFLHMFSNDLLLPVAVVNNIHTINKAIISGVLVQLSIAKNVIFIPDTIDHTIYKEWGLMYIGMSMNRPVLILNNY